MTALLRYFAAHPTAANLLMLAFLILGLLAVPQLQRETFPDFAASKIQISVPYPGAAPADVEDAVCGRIEDALDGVENLAELRCEALENFGRAVAEMREGGDLTQFLDDITSEVEAIRDFPTQSEDPVITTLDRQDAVVSIAITGPMSAPDLKAFAEQFKNRLRQATGVASIDIAGFSQHVLRVELSIAALRAHGLSVASIADTIRQQNVNLPAGSVETRAREILLRFTDERRTPRELANLVVMGGESGAEIRLGDIATIRDEFEDAENQILFDGQRAAVLQVSKAKSEDTLKVYDAVAAFVAAEQARAIPGVTYTLTQNVSSIVRDRLSMLVKNGVQGLILVAMTLWLFFGARFAFWVVMGLPVSFMGTIFFMQALGYSLNMLTMVGLLIAIGLLMDDAIVLAENIATHRQRGKSSLDAAVDGTREVAAGVFSSFLTTLSMFGPLAFISGDIGKVLKVMPVVLILTLAVSLVEAFLILPNHMAHLRDSRASRFREAFERGLAWTREKLLGRAVDAVVTWRYLFLGGVLAIFLISIGMLAGGWVKFKAFPDIDGDVLEARILLPQGTPLARTEALANQLTTALAEINDEWRSRQPEGQNLVQHTRVDFNRNADANETGAHVATVSVDLLTAEQRAGSIDEIIEAWRGKIGEVPDVISLKFGEPARGPAGLAIEILLSGVELPQLQAAAGELRQWLGGYDGVYGLLDDVRPGKPELRLRLKSGATALGVTAQTIAAQLRAAYFGQTAGEVQVGAEDYEIQVRLSATERDSLADLENFTITAASGAQVPLRTVAEVETGRGYARIQRINGVATVTVQGDVDTRVANVREILRHAKKQFFPQLERQYPGLRIVLEGESKSGGQTGASMGRAFLMGLIGIFLLLSFQFRSYLEPLTVMIAIPLGLIGVVWGHWLLGLSLSMPSMMGFVSLAGIVVNDSILLIAFLKQRAAEPGMSVHQAASQASRDRFRAVLLTSLTTIVGLLPLLAEKSLQAQILIPLVASLAFGLMASTVLVLLVIPALYSVLEDWGLANASPKKRPSP